jgi:RNA-directed DNA polymerase
MALLRRLYGRGPTVYRELRALGASTGIAQQVAAITRCWWRNSDRSLKCVLTIPYFDRLDVPPRLS